MSGDDGALPALDDRTRQLIASLIETSVQSALAARAAPSLGDGSGPAVRGPITDSDTVSDPATAAISAGTGDSSEVPAGGGVPGNTHGPPEAREEGEEEDGEAEEADDADADEEDGAGGPPGFYPRVV